jgi:zinc transporter ZupT
MVFFFKKIDRKVLDAMLGFAGGVHDRGQLLVPLGPQV